MCQSCASYIWPMAKIETWEGGIVRRDSKGRMTYVIRRMVAGKRYTVSTRCHKEPAAVIQ